MTNKKNMNTYCPRCKTKSPYDVKNPHRPFCSEACKNSDFIKWHDEEYRLMGEEASDEEILEEQTSKKLKS